MSETLVSCLLQNFVYVRVPQENAKHASSRAGSSRFQALNSRSVESHYHITTNKMHGPKVVCSRLPCRNLYLWGAFRHNYTIQVTARAPEACKELGKDEIVSLYLDECR